MRAGALGILLGAALVPGIALASGVQAQIASGFTKLGMAQAVSQCYGSVIDKNLDPSMSKKAASIVTNAKDASDVENGVKHSNPQIIKAFMAAKSQCGT